MIAANYRKNPQAMALQMVLDFGRMLVWATRRPTTAAARTVRTLRGATFKARGRIQWPVKATTPDWWKEAQRAARELAAKVRAATLQCC